MKDKITKTVSFRIDDNLFKETEKVISELKLSRDEYINRAVSLYNQFNQRQILKTKLAKESRLVAPSSSEVLAEFEKLVNEMSAVRLLAAE